LLILKDAVCLLERANNPQKKQKRQQGCRTPKYYLLISIFGKQKSSREIPRDSGRRGTTAPLSLRGNSLRTMWCCHDLPAGRRLLVLGIAACPNTGRREGMPVLELSARQD
jgi:hypothetical protein